MIPVYVRELEQLDGQLLGEFLPSEIHPLVEMFREFHTSVWDDPDNIWPCGVTSARFASNETGAFFEIVVALSHWR